MQIMRLVSFLLLVSFFACASAQDVSSRRIVERYEPSAEKSLFVPKKTWMGGFTISYSERSTENMNITVLKDLNLDTYNFGVSPFVGYFVADNQAVGVRFNYTRTKIDLAKLHLSLGEDFNINLDNIYYLQNSYDAAAFWRIYMPIAKSKIFAIFNDARLGYAYSESKNSTGVGTEYTGSYTVGHNIMLGIAPGLTAFVTNNAAVEVSMGLMGVDFGWVDQKTNQVYEGSTRTASGRFKIDLLSLNLGMVIYL